MTQKSNRSFLNKIYSKQSKKNYHTNKTDVYHFDDIWSLDISDPKDYGPENKRGYRYVLVVNDNFIKFGWTVPHKNRKTQTTKDFFENIVECSKRCPSLIKTDRGKEFSNKIFQFFFIKTILNTILEIYH